MLGRLKAQLSPALVISLIALFVSLGGAGYAAVTVTGKNVKNSSLTGKDVKNSSLTGSDVKNSSVSGRDVRNGGLSGADIRGDGLSGVQILESSLGKVPAATKADSADSATSAGSADSVGGVSLKPVRYVVTTSSGPDTEIFRGGGLVLTAGCGAGILTVAATSTVADSEVAGYSVESDSVGVAPQNNAYDGDFDPGDSVNLLPSDEDEEIGHLRYSKPDGGSVSIEWQAAGGLNGGTNQVCRFTGVASIL